MRTCFVPLCDVKNRDQPNRTMFLVPREKSLFAEWVSHLPKVRTLRTNDRVCYLHFIPEQIINTFDHIINGELYKLKRDRPRLKHDAIPCLEIPTSDELVSYKAKTRSTSNCKIPREKEEEEPQIQQEILQITASENEIRNPLFVHNHEEDEDEEQPQHLKPCLIDNIEEYEIENVSVDVQQQSIIDYENQATLHLDENINEYDENTLACSSNIEHEQSILNLFNLIYDNVYEILTPNSLWGMHRCPNRSTIYFTFMDVGKMQVTKMITIDSKGFVKLFAHARLTKMLHLMDDIEDINSLSILLEQVDLWSFCFGQDCENIVEPSDDNCWCTDENEQVFLCKICLQQS